MSKESKSIFESANDRHNNACLNFQNDMSHGYIEGYKKAADVLISQVADTAKNQDYLVYPIVFLYRQHIELLLKKIIKSGRYLLEEKPSYPKHHLINDLWALAKEIMNKVEKKSISKEFDIVDQVILELATTDPESFSFRYPTDKKGNKSNPQLRYINLRKFGELLGEISSLLGGVDTGMDYYIEQKHEFERQL